MTYFAEFTTLLLILLACMRFAQALFERHVGMMLMHTFSSGFYGTVALIGFSILDRGA